MPKVGSKQYGKPGQYTKKDHAAAAAAAAKKKKK
jgi:hypothetical protein